MASVNEMWYDVGVRDQQAVDAIRNLMNQLTSAGESTDALVKRTNELMDALNKIRRMKNVVQQAMSVAKANGDSVKPFREQLRALDSYEKKLRSVKVTEDNMKNSNLVSNLLGASYKERLRVISDLLKQQKHIGSSRRQAAKEAERAAKQQAHAEAQAAKEAENAAKAASRSQQQYAQQMLTVNNAMREQSRLAQELKTMLLGYFSIQGARTFLSQMIEIGGEFEIQHVALQNILGDAVAANTMFGQLKSLAVQSPKSFRELASDAKMLAAYSIPGDELYDTTKRLADLSAGLGVSMDRLILAYGQVRSATVLRGQELRQFTEAGVPLVDALAKKFTELNGELVTSKQILTDFVPKKMVSFDMVKQVLDEMTNEGGKFYNMQEKMADTLAGKWSNLRDAWEVMLSNIANSTTTTGRILSFTIGGLMNALSLLGRNIHLIHGALLGLAGIKIANLFTGNGRISGNGAFYQKARKSIYNDALIAQATGSRQLSELETKILGSKKQITAEEYKLLASSKVITENDVKRLVYTGKIKGEMAQQALIAAGLKEEEAARLVGLNKFQKGLKLIGMTGGEVGKAIGSAFANIFTNPYTYVFLLIGWLTSALSRAKQIRDEINNSMKTYREQTNERRTSITETLERVGGTSDSLYDDYVSIRKSLKENAPDYSLIMQEANGIENLGDKYKYLKEQLEQTNEAYENFDMFEDMMRAGIKASKGKRFLGITTDEGLETDLKDYDNALAEYTQKITEWYSGRNNKAQEALKKIQEENPTLQGLNGGQLIKAIVEDDKLYKAYSSQIGVSPYAGGFDDIRAKYKEVAAARDEIYSDNQQILKSIRETAEVEQSMAIQAAGGFEKWVLDPKNEKAIRTMLRRIVDAAGESSQEARRLAEENLLKELRIPVYFDIKGDNDVVMTEFAQTMWQRFGGTATPTKDDVVFINGIAYDANRFSSMVTTEAATQESLAEQVQSRKKDLDAAKSLVQWDGRQDRIDATNSAYQAADNLYHAFYTGDPSEVGKKNKGGDKTDKQLQNLRKQLQQFDKLRQLYSSNVNAGLGVDESLDKVRESGMSYASLLPKWVETREQYEAWSRDIYKQMANALEPNTEDRKAFRDDVLGKLNNTFLDDVKKVFQDLGNALQREIKEGTEKWNLYKNVLDKFGDAGLASQFGVSRKESDVIRESLMGRLPEIQQIAGNRGEYDWSTLLGMTQSEIEDAFGKTSKVWEMMEKYRNAKDSEEKQAITDVIAIMESTRNTYQKLMDELGKAELNKQKIDENPLLTDGQKSSMKAAIDADMADKIFKASPEYLQFFNAAMSMTTKQAEEVGQKIRENLDERMKAGTISAEDYYKEIERIAQQLDKVRGNRGGGWALFSGGLKGRADYDVQVAQDKVSNAAARQADAQQRAKDARERGDEAAANAYEIQAKIAQQEKENAEEELEHKKKFKEKLEQTSVVLDKISSAISGLSQAFDSIMQMAEALGADTGADTAWGDIKAGMDVLNGISNGTKTMVQGVMNGDAGSVISGAVGAITGPITTIAKQHDARLDAQIQKAEEQKQLLSQIKDSLENSLERTLGGIYNMSLTSYQQTQLAKLVKQNTLQTDNPYKEGTQWWKQREAYNARQNKGRDQNIANAAQTAIDENSYYLAEYALLLDQQKQVQKQLDAENKKKNGSSSKKNEYKETLDELELEIRDFATDMAKTLYDIDLKSWASELGDALYDAWKSGENAMDAYKDKLGDLIAQSAKNIITTRILESAMAKPNEELVKLMEANNGVLTEDMVAAWASSIAGLADTVVPNILSAYDALESELNKNGMTAKDSSSSSSGGTTIKGITEDQADVIISYMNGMRADLSAHVQDLKNLMNDTLPGMANTFEMQLAQLRLIEANTRRGADSTERIESLINSMTTGVKKLCVKI